MTGEKRGDAPVMIDAFCKAGGATRGYRQAGWYVIGVDHEPQPNYIGDEFVQADAFEYVAENWRRAAAVHASVPCQDYSPTRSLHAVRYPRWIAPWRLMMRQVGLPYVIENVEGARRHMQEPIRLCGSSFGLGVRRHRLFETNFPVGFVPPCAHYLQPEPIDVTGTGGARLGVRLDGKGGNSRKPRNLEHAREVMGISWMTRVELAEAVPPAYTAWLGEQLLASIERAA